ncbi:hypothetical protein Hdeb2414_s0002g00078181 [Helianthus debilis subsp. tardiflorus]
MACLSVPIIAILYRPLKHSPAPINSLEPPESITHFPSRLKFPATLVTGAFSSLVACSLFPKNLMNCWNCSLFNPGMGLILSSSFLPPPFLSLAMWIGVQFCMLCV